MFQFSYQYQELRVEMAKLHIDEVFMFGPVVLSPRFAFPDEFSTSLATYLTAVIQLKGLPKPW